MLPQAAWGRSSIGCPVFPFPSGPQWVSLASSCPGLCRDTSTSQSRAALRRGSPVQSTQSQQTSAEALLSLLHPLGPSMHLSHLLPWPLRHLPKG